MFSAAQKKKKDLERKFNHAWQIKSPLLIIRSTVCSVCFFRHQKEKRKKRSRLKFEEAAVLCKCCNQGKLRSRMPHPRCLPSTHTFPPLINRSVTSSQNYKAAIAVDLPYSTSPTESKLHTFMCRELSRCFSTILNKVTDRQPGRQTGTSLICFEGASSAIICINAKLLNSLLISTLAPRDQHLWPHAAQAQDIIMD